MESASPSSLFIELMEPTVLYNLLNQAFEYPSVSNPNYLLLIDARKLHEYNESHIVTAKLARKDSHEAFDVPYDGELECKQYIVVYDGTTDSLSNLESDAMKCAQLLANKGSRNKVKVLTGGYERFSALYPFLRTQKILWLPQELDEVKTYPLEIVPGLLYLGNKCQGQADYITKDLKIQGKICCCTDVGDEEESANYMKIPISDGNEEDIKKYLSKACALIDTHKAKKGVVLVYSDLGFSRAAAICVAYLMHANRAALQESYAAVQQCSENACPNAAFLDQLNDWYSETIGAVTAEA